MSGSVSSPYAIDTEGDVDLETEDGLYPIEIEYYLDYAGPDLRFLIVEQDVYKPGTAVVTTSESHLSHPHLALAEFEDPLEASAKIFASDLGYRTMSTDAGGIVVYPPILDQAFQVDNKINLDLAQSGVGAAWGNIVLSNVNDQFDALAATFNCDGRNVRILTGQKTYDTTRQYHRDPSYSALAIMWCGVATPWFLSDTALTIPIRDGSYWLERPYQNGLYGGTGTYDGTAALTGKTIPITRGGTTADPVRNITPTLVDPVNRIYQYSNGRGTVVNLYEGGAPVITFSADTTNLYAGSTPAGQFRTDNSRGLFQLGSVPVHAITADVTGQFPVAGAVTTFAAIARYVMTEDMLLPPELIDLATFTAADAAFPYTSGFYVESGGSLTGIDVLGRILSGPGAKLISKRTGRLALFVLRAVPAGATAVAAFDMSNVVQIDPVALPASLDPPPYRIRSEYSHNYTVQTSDLNTASTTAAHKQFIEETGQLAFWSSTAVLIAFRRPNDPPPLTGILLKLADAQTVVNDLGALFGVRRRQYDVTVPAFLNISRDIGDVVSLTYPMDDLVHGKLGQIIGYSFRSPDASIILRVLV
jgi:hypothetical protein